MPRGRMRAQPAERAGLVLTGGPLVSAPGPGVGQRAAGPAGTRSPFPVRRPYPAGTVIRRTPVSPPAPGLQ